MLRKLSSNSEKRNQIESQTNQNDIRDKFDTFISKIRHQFNKEDEIEQLKPATKYASFFKRIALLNPIGTYKRGYSISVVSSEEQGEEDIQIVTVEEKIFSKRLKFILFVMVLQSIPLSFTMTASISLPWTFNVVIPFSLDMLPFNLKEVIESLILMLQNLLKPFDPLVRLIEEIFKFFSTLNPAILFTGTFWFFDYFGWIDIEKYDLTIPDSYNNGSKTSMDILAYNLEKQFPALGGGLVVPFLLVLFSIMSFFFLITKGRKLLFEIVGEKKLKKNKKICSTLLHV